MRESAIEAKLHIAAAFWPTQPDSGRKCPNYVIAANSCLCECPGMYTLPKPPSPSIRSLPVVTSKRSANTVATIPDDGDGDGGGGDGGGKCKGSQIER